MTGSIRRLTMSEGVEVVGALDNTLPVTSFAVYANDAAYVTAKGAAAAEGDTYWNSTNDINRTYTGGAWVDNNVFDSPHELTNFGLACSVASNALTIAVKTMRSAGDPSATDRIYVGFKNSTITSGSYNRRTISGALSTVISSGSTAGFRSGGTHYLYVYLIDNVATVELAWSQAYFKEGSVVTTTAEGGAGAADSNRVMYSTTARTNVPCRLVGRLKFSLTTAGTWDEVPDELSLIPFSIIPVSCSYETNTAQTLEAAGAGEVIVYEDRVHDSHNFFDPTSGVATVPEAGTYLIMAKIFTNNATWTQGNSSSLSIRISATDEAFDVYTIPVNTGATYSDFRYVCDVRELAAGATIDFVYDHDRTGGDVVLSGAGEHNWMSITKLDY